MVQLLNIAAWNANGLCQHAQEVRTFIHHNNLDIMLISETHCTQNVTLKYQVITRTILYILMKQRMAAQQ